jgi:hypothetical protein
MELAVGGCLLWFAMFLYATKVADVETDAKIRAYNQKVDFGREVAAWVGLELDLKSYQNGNEFYRFPDEKQGKAV